MPDRTGTLGHHPRGERVGLATYGGVATRATTLAVEPHVERGVERGRPRRDAVLLDRRMRDMRSCAQPSPSFEPLADRHVGIEHIDAAIVRMSFRGHVERAMPLGVHHRDDPTAPPCSPRYEVGNEPMLAPVEQY